MPAMSTDSESPTPDSVVPDAPDPVSDARGPNGMPRLLEAPFAVLSGALMVLAFPLYGGEMGLDPLVWVTFVPLFVVACGAGTRRGLFLGWLTGVTLECGGFIWILYAIRAFTGLGTVVPSLLFVVWLLYSAIPWAILGAALGRCRRPAAVLWVVPLWVGIEHAFPRLFPWHVGGALYSREWLLQGADVFGASGLTFAVVLVNATLYCVVAWIRGRARMPVGACVASVAVIAALLLYGRGRLSSLEGTLSDAPKFRVGIVQGCFDPRELSRDDPGAEIRGYLERSDALLEEHGPVDLLVWPEGVRGVGFYLSDGRLDPEGLRQGYGGALLERLRRLNVPIVAGGSGFERRPDGQGEDRYNVAYYIAPGQEPSTYAKNHRLLFGEHVPGLDLLPQGLRARLGNIGNLSPGTTNPLRTLGDHSFRHVICYEVVLPGYMRASASGADFLVNVTEDIWYGRTAHVPQHVSVLILRSVESRVPVVRAANAGPSGVTDITGRFHRTARVFEPDAFVREVAPAAIDTIYERGGWAFPWVALLVGLAGVAGTWLRNPLGKRVA